jgi:hypothetical protein
MYKTEKGSHLVAFHKEANLGATWTTKKQNDIIISKSENSRAYAQGFKVDDDSLKEVKNPQLKFIAENSTEVGVAGACIKISKSKEEYLRMNTDNKQILVKLDQKHRNLSKELISHWGGEEKVNNFITSTTSIIKLKARIDILIFELANSDKKKRADLYKENKELYEELRFVSEAWNGDFAIRLEKINSLLSEI